MSRLSTLVLGALAAAMMTACGPAAAELPPTRTPLTLPTLRSSPTRTAEAKQAAPTITPASTVTPEFLNPSPEGTIAVLVPLPVEATQEQVAPTVAIDDVVTPAPLTPIAPAPPPETGPPDGNAIVPQAPSETVGPSDTAIAPDPVVATLGPMPSVAVPEPVVPTPVLPGPVLPGPP